MSLREEIEFMTGKTLAELNREFEEKKKLNPQARPRRIWRVGTKVPLNVYENDRPVCQCHSALDAALICLAVNEFLKEGHNAVSS